MSESTPNAMDGEAVDAFLGEGGTGVLSLAVEGESPHAVPVSYGYDATERTFYFRLAAGAESEKGELSDRSATFVTYEEDDEDGWRSVVARGTLERIEEAAVASEALAGLGRVDIPLFDVFDAPVSEVTFAFVRLDPAQLTGRAEA